MWAAPAVFRIGLVGVFARAKRLDGVEVGTEAFRLSTRPQGGPAVRAEWLVGSRLPRPLGSGLSGKRSRLGRVPPRGLQRGFKGAEPLDPSVLARAEIARSSVVRAL